MNDGVLLCLVLFGLAINSPLLSIILQSTWRDARNDIEWLQ
jgi:hypothetical protein